MRDLNFKRTLKLKHVSFSIRHLESPFATFCFSSMNLSSVTAKAESCQVTLGIPPVKNYYRDRGTGDDPSDVLSYRVVRVLWTPQREIL